MHQTIVTYQLQYNDTIIYFQQEVHHRAETGSERASCREETGHHDKDLPDSQSGSRGCIVLSTFSDVQTGELIVDAQELRFCTAAIVSSGQIC